RDDRLGGDGDIGTFSWLRIDSRLDAEYSLPREPDTLKYLGYRVRDADGPVAASGMAFCGVRTEEEGELSAHFLRERHLLLAAVRSRDLDVAQAGWHSGP